MDKKLVVRLLETANECKGKHRLFDPLIKSGYSSSQIDEAVSFCIENGLLDNRTFRSEYNPGPENDDEWWAMGLSDEGFQALDDLSKIHGSREDLGLY